MDLNEINKEWLKYEHSYILPSFLTFTILLLFSIFIGVLTGGNFNIITGILVFLLLLGYATPISWIAFIIIFAHLKFVFNFLIASDKLFKILGRNRLFSNIINTILTLCFLGFITSIFLGLEVRRLNKENKQNKNTSPKTPWYKQMK